MISNHAYDFSPNCTPLSSVTIMNWATLSKYREWIKTFWPQPLLGCLDNGWNTLSRVWYITQRYIREHEIYFQINSQQLRSSVISPQSLSPSQTQSLVTHRWLSQVNSSGAQVDNEQFESSSDSSPQSSSSSHTYRFGMHWELLHKNLSTPQPLGSTEATRKRTQVRCQLSMMINRCAQSSACAKCKDTRIKPI